MRRLYRLALFAYPRAFRRRFGDELTAAFLAGLQGARRRRGSTAYVAGRIADALSNGAAERWARWRRRERTAPGARTGRVRADVRQTVRLLWRQPAFALVVIATLAIGIGANAAVLAIADGVLLRPHAYRDPGRLVFFWTKLEWVGVPRAWMSGGHIGLLQRETTRFDAFVAMRVSETQLVDAGEPAQIRVGVVSPNLTDALGVAPAAGRAFQPEDGAPGAAPVALVSHALWQERFGGRPEAIGRRVRIGGTGTEIVGVLPQGFRFWVPASLGGPADPDVWTAGSWDFTTMPTSPFSFALLGRVRAGATVDDARAEVNAIGARLDREVYGDKGFGWHVIGLSENLTSEIRPVLATLSAAAALVFLIAAANVGSLVLLRAAGRERELGVRRALGAAPGRLAAQLVTEGVTLASMAAVPAVVIAVALVRAVQALLPGTVPRLDEVGLDVRMVAVTAAVALAAGAIIGLLPMVQAMRPPVTGGAGFRLAGTRRSDRLRSVFVTAQIATALVLTVGALLLARTYATVLGADPGFRPAAALSARVSLPAARYPQGAGAAEAVEAMVARLGATPGVVAAGATSGLPLSRRADQHNVTTPGAPPDSQVLVDRLAITPGYVAAAGLTLLAGRDFEPTDRAGAARVALVDHRLAAQLWPDDTPVGRTVHLDVFPDPVVVVGVVRQARLYEPHADNRSQVYLPLAQTPSLGVSLVARFQPGVEPRPGLLRAAVRAVDPDQPVADVATLTTVVERSLVDRRLMMTLVVLFAGVALLLTCVGVYGLAAYAVSQRTREIGVRLALGAAPGAVGRLVVGQTARLALVGLLIGAVASRGAARLIEGQLFGVRAGDPGVLAAACGGLLLLVVFATARPARRAARVDPVQALRAE